MHKKMVFNVDEVAGFSPKGSEDSYISKMLIDNTNVGSQSIVLNEFTLKSGKQTYKGDHGEGNDEIYFITKGEAILYLEDPETHELESYRVRPGSYAFIKGGTAHYVVNDSSEDLIMLTFMPHIPQKGVNVVYDERIETYGKSFILKSEV